MKPTNAISIIALAAALVAGPALADGLNVGVGVNADAGVSTSSENGNSSANADLGVNTDVGVNVGGDGEGGDNDGVAAEVTGSIGGAVNVSGDESSLDLDALVNLITTADYSDDSFSSWSSANADVTSVLNVDELFDATGNAAIDAAVAANLDEQDDLSAAISANADLSAWLETHGIDAESVIAIDVAADGSVDVYEG